MKPEPRLRGGGWGCSLAKPLTPEPLWAVNQEPSDGRLTRAWQWEAAQAVLCWVA